MLLAELGFRHVPHRPSRVPSRPVEALTVTEVLPAEPEAGRNTPKWPGSSVWPECFPHERLMP